MHATQPTPTVVDPTPADTLRHAADYLEVHGWCQKSYYGTWVAPNPPACTVGALAIVAYGYAHPEPFCDVFHDDEGQITCWSEFVNAEFALACYLGLHRTDEGHDPDDIESVHDWNDAQGRSAVEVIATLRAAAQDYQQQAGVA